MNTYDKLHMLIDLTTEYCGLNHGPDTRREDYPASNYIVIPFGYQENAVTEVSVRDLVIPICLECSQALTQDEWTLIYCFECNNSRWLLRKYAKNDYRHHIIFLHGCPDCSNEFGGLYFCEEPKEQFVYQPMAAVAG